MSEHETETVDQDVDATVDETPSSAAELLPSGDARIDVADESVDELDTDAAADLLPIGDAADGEDADTDTAEADRGDDDTGEDDTEVMTEDEAVAAPPEEDEDFDARVRPRAREEHGRDLDEKRRAVLDCLHHVHALRLRHQVRRR